MTIIRHIPWTEQPQGSFEVNWANPMARGLLLASLPGVDASLKNEANLPYKLTRYAAGDTSAVTSEFGPMRGNGGAAGTSYFGPDKVPLNSAFSASGAASVLCILSSAAGDATGSGGPFGLRGPAPNADHYPFTDGKLYLGTFSGTRWASAVTPSFSLTRPHAVAVTHRSGAQNLYLNGVSAASASNVETPVIDTGAIADQRFASNGSIYFVAFWNRILSPTEIRELSANPWQLFTPRAQRIWAPSLGGAYTLNAETGVYTFTGSNATLLHNYALTLDSASYSLTGSNATLLKGLILDAASGSYTLTGSNATLVYNKLLNASSGSYSVSGADANLIYTPTAGAYVLNAESGAYVLTGSDVTFSYSGGTITLKAGSWIRYRIIT